jgi:hypothetical protein
MSAPALVLFDLDHVPVHHSLNQTLLRTELFQRGLLEDRPDAP